MLKFTLVELLAGAVGYSRVFMFWQAVCKLPFIEELRLLSEIEKVEHMLMVRVGIIIVNNHY